MRPEHPHTGRQIARASVWWSFYQRFERHPDPPGPEMEARLPPLAARVFYIKGEVLCLRDIVFGVLRGELPTAQQFDLCYLHYAALYDAELKALLESDTQAGLERIFTGLQAEDSFIVHPDNWFFQAPVRSMMTGDIVLIPDTNALWVAMPLGWERIGG